jgi:hypothetical protein
MSKHAPLTDASEFHRHEFDLETGREVRKYILTRGNIPTLGQFFIEVAQQSR